MSKVRNAAIQRLLGPERLRALQTRRNGPGLVFLAAHLALSLATGWLLWRALGTLWALPLTLLHGVVLVHWFAPFHESVHGTAFANPRLNVAVAWLSGLVVQLPPTHFRFEHAAHHAYTSDPRRDPERIPHADTLCGYLWYFSALPYFNSLLSTLLRLPFGRFTDDERRFIPRRHLPRARRDVQLMWLVYASVLALSLWAGSWAAVTLWLLPRVAGEPLMRLIRMSEHGGCEAGDDMLRNTRTVRASRPLRWLAWNMCLHAEHHALPQVPFHALPRLHAALGERLVYVSDGYPAAQRALIRHALGAGRRR